MRKLLSILLVVMLTFGITTTAFATGDTGEESDRLVAVSIYFRKAYNLTNPGTTSPEETFTFAFEPVAVRGTSGAVTVENMPAISDASVTFDEGLAGAVEEYEGGGAYPLYIKTVYVSLSGVTWPEVGQYIYKVTETAESTAGVTYDSAERYMIFTVTLDHSGHEEVYGAVMMSDPDSLDSKVEGFTNEYSAGKLAISKTVTGAMGNTAQYFAVKVTLTGQEGKNYQNSYAVAGGSKIENGTDSCAASTISIGTPKTFYVKHDETITIENLPYGVTYTVEEVLDSSDPLPYTATYAFSDNGETKMIDSAEETVGITNNRNYTPNTGIGLDSAPYLVILLAVAVGLGLFFMRKRSSYER